MKGPGCNGYGKCYDETNSKCYLCDVSSECEQMTNERTEEDDD